MEISNSEDLQQTEHRELCLSHLNYVDGISADNNAEFEFLRIKRNQSVHWCLSVLEPFGIRCLTEQKLFRIIRNNFEHYCLVSISY